MQRLFLGSAFTREKLNSRSTVVIDPVDLATDEDPDPTVGPFSSVGQQEGNEQSQTCKSETHA